MAQCRHPRVAQYLESKVSEREFLIGVGAIPEFDGHIFVTWQILHATDSRVGAISVLKTAFAVSYFSDVSWCWFCFSSDHETP